LTWFELAVESWTSKARARPLTQKMQLTRTKPSSVVIRSCIEEYALGRKLTQSEHKRFVEKNILTIQRQRR
jgi:hypothetical protein